MESEIIYFYLPSDTLVYSAIPIINNLDKANSRYAIVIPRYNESSEKALKSLGQPFQYLTNRIFSRESQGKLVLFNDWDKTSKYVILLARKAGIPSICIQESMIDFFSKNRMCFADTVFLQSEFYRKLLARDNVKVFGNPRYDNIKLDLSMSSYAKAMVNCNFTYGIFEEVRNQWINEVVDALKSNKIPFFISKHPRDHSNVSQWGEVVESNAASISDQLNRASLLISRFSSVIHEAVLSGVPVIYFNPHGESMVRNLNIDNRVVLLAHNVNELKQCINRLNQNRPPLKAFDEYIHYSITASTDAAKLIANNLTTSSYKATNWKSSDLGKMLYFHPVTRQISRRIRKLMSWG